MSAVSDSLLTSARFGNLQTDLYVFVDGKLNPVLTQKSPESSVSVITLKEAFASVPNFAETFLSKSTDKSDLFANLGSAFLQDGTFISILDRKVQTRPVHFLFISTGNLVQPKLIISAGKSSESTFIEHFISDGNPAGFTMCRPACFSLKMPSFTTPKLPMNRITDFTSAGSKLFSKPIQPGNLM